MVHNFANAICYLIANGKTATTILLWIKFVCCSQNNMLSALDAVLTISHFMLEYAINCGFVDNEFIQIYSRSFHVLVQFIWMRANDGCGSNTRHTAKRWKLVDCNLGSSTISIETETSLFRQKIKHENYSHCAQWYKIHWKEKDPQP